MTSSGFEWVLLAMGVVLTVIVVGIFIFVLTRGDETK
jgi:hypothetical protein